jgi:hypothetical protein
MPRTKPKETAKTQRRRRQRELLRKYREAEAKTEAKPSS